MPNQTDLSAVLSSTEPVEAISFFRQKGYRIGFDYRDVWQQEHQAAFTVAKATQLDLLKDIRGEVDQALANGTTFADFRRALQPRLMDRGWWGKAEVTDPVTGDQVEAQLGSTKRLRTIFETNLSTAYSEGQWERIQRGKALFPFLEYGHSASEHPRLKHKAWAGTVLPADHPWWQNHMPVREWGCKCPVYQHSATTLQGQGLAVTDAPVEQMREVVNKRTGETMSVPVGVDPAFYYPPGGRRANLGKMMMDKADAGAALTTARVIADGAEQWAPLVQQEFSEFVGRYAEGERREIGSRRVAGAMSPALVKALSAAGVEPRHATISVGRDQLPQLLDSKNGHPDATRPADSTKAVTLVSSLPGLLRHVGEAWLDAKRLVLLCSSIEPGLAVKVEVALDQALPGADVANAVQSIQTVSPKDFSRKGLLRLDTAE